MAIVKDGYIQGTTAPRQKKCGVCGARTLCIDITGVTLPKGVTTRATILHANKDDRTDPSIVTCIGVGCGCYARFHRQMAHITHSSMATGKAV